MFFQPYQIYVIYVIYLHVCVFIGAALAVGAIVESFAATGSAANALAPKVAAKIPANNADNNLFMINFLYKIKCDG